MDRHASSIGMKLNDKKTNIIMFNPAYTHQAVPFIAVEDGSPLPVIRKMRLLGLLLDCDLTWWPLVMDLVNRCKSKIWSLMKLREAGANRQQLTILYTARVRCTIEYGCQLKYDHGERRKEILKKYLFLRK